MKTKPKANDVLKFINEYIEQLRDLLDDLPDDDVETRAKIKALEVVRDRFTGN